MTATAAPPRERPILFSGEMVRAILDCRKTQTRRVVLPQPDWTEEVRHTITNNGPFAWPIGGLGQQCGWPLPLRYQIGDRLWVREAHSILDMRPEIEQAERATRPAGDCRVSVTYRADNFSRTLLCHEEEWRDGFDSDHVVWRPSIHMPRWASRLTLEITGVRVERVQSITGADARAEGIEPYPHVGAVVIQYKQLWDDLNAKRGYGWDVNPWVWVVEFRKVAL